MSNDPSPLDPSELLADASWMRALAWRLVRDHGAAEDLVQETWVASLQRGERPTRAWVRGVMRNLAKLRSRTGARRRQRELQASGEREVPTPAELSSRIETQRRLAEAVLRLREPYRETVLLRFSEELQPAEIAEHLGLPGATVRSRLKRGLALLREDLEGTYGEDHRNWALALTPLARLFDAGQPSALTPAALSLAGVGLVGALSLVVFTTWETPASSSKLDERAALAPDLEYDTNELSHATPPDRAVDHRGPANAVAQEVTPSARTSGRVIDSRGRALPNVGVGFSTDRWASLLPDRASLTETNGLGEFAFEHDDRPGIVLVADAEWTTLQSSTHWPERGERELVVIAARFGEVAGVVRDERGREVVGARVKFQLPTNFRASFEVDLDAANDTHRSAHTDESGIFRFPALPFVEGAQLIVTREGGLRSTSLAPQHATRSVELLLPGPATVITGVVVDERGRGFADAKVTDGVQMVSSDAHGEFQLPLHTEDLPLTLRAVAVGRQPAVAAPESVTQHMLLMLGEPTLSIAGRVLDEHGAPIVGAQVSIADATAWARDADGSPLVLEALTRAEDSFPWQEVSTDEQGAFELDGLVDREYTLSVLGSQGLRAAEFPAMPAGSVELSLTLPATEVRSLRARLVSPDGEALEGAAVWLERERVRLPKLAGERREWGSRTRVRHVHTGRVFAIDPDRESSRVVIGELRRTDAEGYFEFEAVPAAAGVFLSASGNGLLPAEWATSDLSSGETLILSRMAHALFLHESELEFDSLQLVDASGRLLELCEVVGDLSHTTSALRLEPGRPVQRSIPVEAREVVLSLAGEVIARVPIRPLATELLRVQL